MGELLIDETLKNRIRVFEDREEAGKRLGEFLKRLELKDPIVLPIPSGGVPVGVEVARILNAPVEPLVVRKIQLPWNPEAGFGAVNEDGEVFLNERLLKELNLSEEEMNRQIERTIANVRDRVRKFKGGKGLPDLRGRTAIVVDDGLASGYTIRAALSSVKKRKPREVIVAVPTCSARSSKDMLSEVDRLVCLNLREGFPFAVADAYRNWRDVEEEEALGMLREFSL